MNILFASANKNKILEVKSILSDHNVISLSEVDFHEDIEETGSTYEENAKIKGLAISKMFPDYLVVADDSGIEFDCFGDLPGVYSHRFMSELTERERNLRVIEKANETGLRQAKYVCCMVTYKNGEHLDTAQSEVYGEVTAELHEGRLFAYDSIFKTDEYKSWDVMPAELKNKISHRRFALLSVAQFINSL